MKTLLLCAVILSVLFLWYGPVAAQETDNQVKPATDISKTIVTNAENSMVLQTSKIMQKPAYDAVKTNFIKVVVTNPGEKITAVNENRETAKKGGSDEK